MLQLIKLTLPRSTTNTISVLVSKRSNLIYPVLVGRLSPRVAHSYYYSASCSHNNLCLLQSCSQSNRFAVPNRLNHQQAKKNEINDSPSSSSSTINSSPSFSDDSSNYSLDKIDLQFRDTKQAYKSKTCYELFRANLILYVTSFDFLVFNHARLLKIGRAILGKTIFHGILKATFFGQFVAGEDDVTIRPVLDHLRSFGVKSILDYSSEEDLQEDKPSESSQSSPRHADDSDKQYKSDDVSSHRSKFRPVARTYFYQNEASCERNMDIFLRCIDSVKGSTYGTGFAAIKLTALGRPELLLQISEVIARSRKYFQDITGKKLMAFANVSPSEFKKQLDERFNVHTENVEIRNFIKGMDSDQCGLLNLFCWNGLIDMQTLVNDLFKVPNLRTGRLEQIHTALTPDEEEMFANMMRRVHTIAEAATDRDVRILIDAEQTYFQPAINRITLELMRKYNKEKAIIFNTYQCYLRNAHETCHLDAELSRRQGFYFGAKLVRGAYLDQERLRAKQLGYEDPINPTYDATTAMYEKNLDFFLKKIVDTGIQNQKFAIMVATHNEDTVRYTLKRMNELGIEPKHRVICFGQLYGMSDHVSFNLGQSGYSIYKYVPYGPIDEVMPYLSRRALENHSILRNSSQERKLLKSELRRRFWTFNLFYKPKGNYRIL